jgi:hypothetical protein
VDIFCNAKKGAKACPKVYIPDRQEIRWCEHCNIWLHAQCLKPLDDVNTRFDWACARENIPLGLSQVLAWPIVRGHTDAFCSEAVVLTARELIREDVPIEEKTWRPELLQRLLSRFQIDPADFDSDLDEVERRRGSIVSLIDVLSTTDAPTFFLCPRCEKSPV